MQSPFWQTSKDWHTMSHPPQLFLSVRGSTHRAPHGSFPDGQSPVPSAAASLCVVELSAQEIGRSASSERNEV
jgi:hypothetical protein